MSAARFSTAIPFVASPNKSSRKGATVDCTVLHFTGSRPGVRGGADGDVSWLCDPKARASAHFVVGRDGAVTQIVALEEAAWHAGASALVDVGGALRANVNAFSIGIELDNLGPLYEVPGGFKFEAGGKLFPYVGPAPFEGSLVFDSGHKVAGYWEPYAEPQLHALERLLAELRAGGYARAASSLVGHEDVALPIGRKIDPGPAFPWARFGSRVYARTRAEATG